MRNKKKIDDITVSYIIDFHFWILKWIVKRLDARIRSPIKVFSPESKILHIIC